MKRQLLLLLAICLALTLTGCSSSSTEAAVELPLNDPTSAPEPTEAVPALVAFEKLDWSIVEEATASDFTYEIVTGHDKETYEEIDAVRILSYNGSDTIIHIPDQIDGMPVSQIAEGMFAGNTTITYVSLPVFLEIDSSESEPRNLFNGCTALLQVRMPADCTSIPAGMFSGCTALRCVEFPASGNVGYRYGSVGNDAFRDCAALTEIVLPDGITKIGERAFKDCTNLISVTARGANVISEDAFRDCVALKHLELCGSSPALNGSAFCGCTDLDEIVVHMPEDHQPEYTRLVVEGYALYGVYENSDGTHSILYRLLPGHYADTIELRDDLVRIEYYAMENSRIRYIELPASLREIESRAFRTCWRLTRVAFEDGSQLAVIRKDGFCNCEALEIVDLSNVPEDVDVYDDMQNCPLLRFVMPGEDPNATPEPELTEEEAVAAIEAVLDPFRSEMESEGYSYHLSMDGNEMSQFIFYTNKTSLTDIDRDLLSRISSAMLSSGLTGLSGVLVNEAKDFSFTDTALYDMGSELFEFLMIPDGTYAFCYTRF